MLMVSLAVAKQYFEGFDDKTLDALGVYLPLLHPANRAHHPHKQAWFDHSGWVSNLARAYIGDTSPAC